ncbi:hypothetical protein [Desulfobulbus propionicus]
MAHLPKGRTPSPSPLLAQADATSKQLRLAGSSAKDAFDDARFIFKNDSTPAPLSAINLSDRLKKS